MNRNTVVQSAQDSLEAVYKLRNDLEGKFIEMGQIFAHIKQTKLFRFKGYESFRDYIEQEHNISLSLANKLIRIQSIFVQDMDQDEETLKEIGMDRLIMIAPLMSDAPQEVQEELLQIAGDLPIPELKAELKERKEAASPDEATDLKKLLIEQFKEKVCCWLNCTWTEAMFKLGLWFCAMPYEGDVLAEMKAQIKVQQRQFEAEVTNADREA